MGEPSEGPPARAILVCGLGRLGQHCVRALREFGVPLRAIDLRPPDAWEIEDASRGVEALSVGDCRSADTLRRAGVESCRAVVIVTGADRVNVAAALVARSLNPGARIVVRSAQPTLNRLLYEQLGDFVAYDSMALAAPAFALAALGEELVGLFRIADEIVRVVRVPIGPGHGWIGRRLFELNGTRRRLLTWKPPTATARPELHQWSPEAVVEAGSVITCIEVGDEPSATRSTDEATIALTTAGPLRSGRWRDLRASARALWRRAPQAARVAVAASLVSFVLYVSCALLYAMHYPDLGVQEALNVAMVLILGGYDNLFGQLHMPFAIPAWLHLFSVLVSVSGTVGIGIIYAFLTDRVLAVRLQAFRRRPSVPREGHVVVFGGGPLALAVSDFFRRIRRRVVIVSEAGPDLATYAGAHVTGRPDEHSMKRARVFSARSVLAMEDDDVANLEAALGVRAMSRARLVLRFDDAQLREGVARLVAGARSLGVLELAAEAFAAAAFGEHVHDLLHVDGGTLVVVEYRVDETDTLQGRLLGDLAYGHGVAPLSLRREGAARADFFPSDDIRLRPGDQLVVVASPDSLRTIEHGTPAPPGVHLRVIEVAGPDAAFHAAMAIAKVTGCELSGAQDAIARAPSVLGLPLYPLQAWRLARELAALRVTAEVSSSADRRSEA